jgi:NADH:ubiquinone oxidoreductase subunit E
VSYQDTIMFAQFRGVGLVIREMNDHSQIIFEAGENMNTCLTDPTLIVDGRTIGQANRDQLHEMLDVFLDANLKESKT